MVNFILMQINLTFTGIASSWKYISILKTTITQCNNNNDDDDDNNNNNKQQSANKKPMV
jgi:hypothetical protein